MRKIWIFVIALTVLLGIVVTLPLGTRTAEAQTACGTNVVYVVARGDTLFRIARRFGTTMAALQAANNIANINRILVGQQLVIVCPTTGPVTPIPPLPLTPVPPIIVTPPHVPGTGFCAGFRATSPLGGLLYGENTFFWDGAPGATAYRVNIYNLDEGGALRVSFNTFAPNTNLRGDVGGPAGGGFRFAWEVEALFAGQVICRTPRQTMFRASPPPVPPTAVPTIAPVV